VRWSIRTGAKPGNRGRGIFLGHGRRAAPEKMIQSFHFDEITEHTEGDGDIIECSRRFQGISRSYLVKIKKRKVNQYVQKENLKRLGDVYPARQIQRHPGKLIGDTKGDGIVIRKKK